MASNLYKVKNWWKILPLLALALGMIIGMNGAFAGAPATSIAAPQAVQPAANIGAPTTPFDCSQISSLGIDKQMNLHAAELLAGCGYQPKTISTNPQAPSNLLTGAAKAFNPLYGGTDANASAPQGDGAYPKVTESESFVWAHGNNVMMSYNDSRQSSACYAGYSWSSDGGATWTRPGGATGASPLCTGHGTNFGDPTVVYSVRDSKWYLSDLASGCGGQGLGVWESTDGMNITTGACAHTGTQDDRQSHWIDNNPASPFYGRQYISWNNFAAGQFIYVTFSDNGTTWSAPVQVTTTFIRNVQMTGSPTDGTVFIAGMNEGGGGLNNRTNIMHRSTNGGATWTAITMGAAFPGPGVATSGYFALMFPTIWRHMGWGQPAAGPNQVVHYAYTQHGAGSDAADMMYTRSTDNGSTWSAPIMLNTDGGTRPQWQGNLAATAEGGLFSSWYDGREAASCGTPGQNTPCYRRWGRVSLNNGASWQADEMLGDSMSPLPAQPDSGVQGTYEGDYDYASADGDTVYTGWTDGRVLINSTSQQDVFFDKVLVQVGTPTPTHTPCSPVPCTSTPTNTATDTRTPTITPTPTNTPTITLTRTITITRTITPTRTITRTPTISPTRTITISPTITPTQSTCGPSANYEYAASTGAAIVPGTTDTGNHTDDGTTAITLPFSFTFYGASFTGANVSSNGNMQFTSNSTEYSNVCLPFATFNNAILGHWDDLRTDAQTNCSAYPSGCGIFTSTSGSAPNRIFNIEWRTVLFTGATVVNFEIRLYETTGRFDIVYGTVNGNGVGATIGVQRGTGTQFTQFSCNTASLSTGLQLAFTQPPCGSPTATFTQGPATNTPTITNTRTPTNTFTPVPTATCPPVTVPVSIIDFAFQPDPITINVGTTVVWSNNGSAPHTSTSSTNLWDSGTLNTGDQFSVTFNGVGTYTYLCTIHTFMTGTINVIAGCAPTATSTPVATNTFTNTRTNTPTNTPVPPTNTRTNTATTVPTNTATPTRTNINAFAHFELPALRPATAPQTPVLDAITVPLGSKVSLDLFVNSGSNNVNASQNYLTFTDSLVQNVNAAQSGCVLTSTFTPDLSTFDAVLQNEMCNGPSNCTFRGITVGPGSMAFASGALNSCPDGCTGDFRVAQLALCAVGLGDALVHWQFAPPAPITRDTEIVDVNSEIVSNRTLFSDLTIHIVNAPVATETPTPAPTNTATNTPTNTPIPLLVGHVTWQSRPAQPNALQSLPITLTLKSADGVTEVNYAMQTTDASGYFTVSLGGLANGSYSWRVKGPDATARNLVTDLTGFLANNGSLSLAGTPSTQQEMGLMRAGDANNDDLVNVTDFNIVKASFGRSVGQPDYDNRADFNGDGTVNISDYNLIKFNFGSTGQPPIGPRS